VGHRAGVNPGNSNHESESGMLDWPTSAHAASRFIMSVLPDASPVEIAAMDGDPRGKSEEPPVLATPKLIEGTVFRAIRFAPERETRPVSEFTGFLDGAQEVRVVNHVVGIPIVWATVSAAVRVRHNRRLTTWAGHAPALERRYYLPLQYLTDLRAEWKTDPRVVDTARPDSAGVVPTRHPAALLERAMQRIQQDREDLERRLAEAWCNTESSRLYVDGSITASATASTSSLAVGVIKNHRTLYADGDAFRVVVSLRPGERSSAFRVAPRSRNPVASWYVRIRSAVGRDALFGLVRVEAAEGEDLTARADDISRWIVAEGSPLALPDHRWDKLSYGVRDAEEFLRAIS
jgi:hypothetical protein